MHCIIIIINCNFMLKLVQHCNYIVIVMQIKLMLLLLLFLIGDQLIDSGGSRPSDKEGGRGWSSIPWDMGGARPPRPLPGVRRWYEDRLIGVWLYNVHECSRSSPCDRKNRKAESGIGRKWEQEQWSDRNRYKNRDLIYLKVAEHSFAGGQR